ncbi:uncharacterized protein PAC_11985 [Phialocephala subalpina]|uniref:Uncharacterized protein n=1 Tax=Phialocephala subalpina TaxID=576137 RepID=A0A1L7XAM5_9HELO|nr:uncharacterized protein PAC_11985 [Phialocephala subalpina]
MSRPLAMDLTRFSRIPEFVTKYIREQNFDEDDGAHGRTLIRLCLEEFLDETKRQDRESMTAAKDEVIASVKRLVAEGVLCLLKKDNKPHFRLGPEALADKNDKESTIVVDAQQRGRDAEEAETSMLEGEDTPLEEAEADRHAAGYAEMTRGARPFVPPPAEEDISTPSRKRRRIEIAASDSNSWNSISPIPHPNSTPRRRRPPPVSPLSGSRRRSAPMDFLSPRKQRDPRDYEAEEQIRQQLFKQEMKDTSPPWLTQGLEMLRPRYPDDLFEAQNGMIQCLDCRRPFKPANNGVSNFDTHLRSKTHRACVSERLRNMSTYQHTLPSTKMIDVDLNFQQAPLTVFANKQQERSVKDIANELFSKLDGDTGMTSIRLSMIDSRLAAMNNKVNEQRGHFDKVLESSQKCNKDMKEKLNMLSDVIKSTEEKCENQVRDFVKQVETSDFKNGEQLRTMSRRMMDLEGRCETKLSETNTRIARYNQRTLDQYDSTNERITKSELESKTKLEQLSSQINQLVKKNKSQDELIAKLDEVIAKFQSQAEENRKDVQGLQEQSQELEVRIKELERENKGQEDEIQDLLAQTQLHTEELQRQRDSEENFMKTIRDQMQAHFEQTDRTIKKLSTENEDRMELMEQQMFNRIKAIEDHSSKKIRSLEKKYVEQKENIDRFEIVVPTILEDARARDEYLDELAKLITEPEEEVVYPSPKKEKARRDVRRTSVAR